MIRSFNLDLLLRATNIPEIKAPSEDFLTWFSMPMNVMLEEGENVGLATYDYSGMYTVHWYYTVRGREAITLGKRMSNELFDKYDAKILRALIRTSLKSIRWACRQVGFKSHGIITFPDEEDNELFTATKEDING